jgi:glycosyltransferase involved in cell wall biosynthesis
MKSPPTFALVTIGSGDYLGSTVRDLALANAMHRRGYKVVIYWMMEIQSGLADAGIEQRMLCHGTRYHFARPSEFLDRVVGRLLFLLPQAARVRVVQGQSGYVDRLLGNLIAALYGGPDGDARLSRRLRDWITRDRVSHLMLSFASLGPLALQAKRLGGHDFDYALTFQGDEQFAAYAKRLGLLDRFRTMLNDAVRGSSWPAVVVSADYADRIVEELDVPRRALKVLYNGVKLPQPGHAEAHAFSTLKPIFPGLSQQTPIITYVGRQDVEKGIDLLLYAARILIRRGLSLQVVVCGSTAKGPAYRKVLSELSEHLGLPLFHASSVTNEVRDCLYIHSHCVVYPSINREPFGLVVAEAMSHGVPVLVPDYGGIGEVIRDGTRMGGLTFNAWDSGDLASQLERLLRDRALRRQLASNARSVAARFSVDNMTDDVLKHFAVTGAARGLEAAAGSAADSGTSAGTTLQ